MKKILITIIMASLMMCFAGCGVKSTENVQTDSRKTEAAEDLSNDSVEAINLTDDESNDGSDTDTSNGPIDKEVLSAYAEVLTDHESAIKKYYWQEDNKNEFINEFDYTDEDYLVDDPENKCIALYDLNGDNTPELLFFENDAQCLAGLHIYTIKNGSAVECSYENAIDSDTLHSNDDHWFFDYHVAAGIKYMIYAGKEAGTFYIATREGDEYSSYTNTKYELDTDANLSISRKVNNYFFQYEGKDEYSIDDQVVDEEAGTQAFKKAKEDFGQLLMFSGYNEELSVFEYVKSEKPIAMTYDEAIAELQK